MGDRLRELAALCEERRLTPKELGEAADLFASSSRTVGEIEAWLAAKRDDER